MVVHKTVERCSTELKRRVSEIECKEEELVTKQQRLDERESKANDVLEKAIKDAGKLKLNIKIHCAFS